LGQLGKHLDVLIQECSFSVAAMQTVVIPESGVITQELQLPQSFRGRRAVVIRLIRDAAIQRSQELPSRLGLPNALWVATHKADVDAAMHVFTLTNAAYTGAPAGTCAVIAIKPHLLRSKRGGEALHLLLTEGQRFGGQLQAISQFAMSSAQADAFCQPYKGILGQHYRGTVEQFSAGTLWAIQLLSPEAGSSSSAKAAGGLQRESDSSGSAAASSVSTTAAAGAGDLTFLDRVRELCGPFDPAIGKLLRPKSLRARFGSDVAHNGLQCTDLPEDAADDVATLFYGASIVSTAAA